MTTSPHDQSWPLTHAEALALLRLHGHCEAFGGAEPLGEGDFCLAFRHGGNVLRVAKHPGAAAALLREAGLLEVIAPRLPLAVPRPRFELAGPVCAFSVHRMVEGTPLSAEGWDRLAPDDRVAAARALGAFLDALHATPPEIGVPWGLPILSASARTERMQVQLCRFRGDLGSSLARRIERTLERSAADGAGADAGIAILHQDVAPGHVLHDPSTSRLTGIIDFGDLALGDPARDFVYVYADFGSPILADVLEGYGREPADALLPRIHLWYLLEALDWTLDRISERSTSDVTHGIGEIVRELDWLDARTTGGRQ